MELRVYMTNAATPSLRLPPTLAGHGPEAPSPTFSSPCATRQFDHQFQLGYDFIEQMGMGSPDNRREADDSYQTFCRGRRIP